MKKHIRNAAWALAGAAFLAVSAGSIGAARADCLSPAECICSGSPADAVLAITVTAVLDNKDIEGTVDSLDVAPGKAVQVVEGDTVKMDPPYLEEGEVVVGDRVLAAIRDGKTKAVILIDADDHVTCQYSKDYRPTVEHATEALMTESCYEDILKEIPPGECNDTSTSTACSAAHRGQSGSRTFWAAAGVLVLGMAGAAWRRRTPAKR